MTSKSLRLIPWIVGFGLLMENLDVTVINTAIPQMARDLLVSPLSLKIAITSYLLSLAAVMPISGYVADRLGSKTTFSLAMMIFMFGSMIASLSQSLAILVCGRVIQGVGGAMMTPVGRLILLHSFSKSKFTEAFSLYTIFGQIGPAIGPAVGGALTTAISWRWVFFINIPIGFVALFFIYRFIDQHKSDDLKPFDGVGFVLFGMAIALLVFALTLLTEPEVKGVVESIMLLASLLLFGIYLWHARQTTHPVINLSLFRVPTFRIAVTGSLVVRLAIGAIPFLLPLLFQLGFGWSAFKSGLFLVPYGVALIAAKPFVGRCIRQFGYANCLLVNPILVSASVLSFILFSKNSSPLLIVFLVMVAGFFCSLQFTFMNTLNFVDINAVDRSAAASVSSVVQQVAMSFGVCVAAGLLLLFGAANHANAISSEIFHHVWMGLAVIPLLSLGIFVQLRFCHLAQR